MAVDRSEQLFSLFDVDNDGDITEEEFIEACLNDQELLRMLSSKHGVESDQRDSDRKVHQIKDAAFLPRNSKSAENRTITRRRYSNLCKRKNL